jgi:hypothetical protein
MCRLRRGDGVQGRADAVLRLVIVADDLEPDQGRAPVGGDLAVVARGIRTLDPLGVRDVPETLLDVRDHGAEVWVGGCRGVALDQHELVRAPLERVVDRRRRLTGFADAQLVLLEGLGPDGTADRKGDEDERQPPPDSSLAMSGAPATRPRRDAARRLHSRGPSVDRQVRGAFHAP